MAVDLGHLKQQIQALTGPSVNRSGQLSIAPRPKKQGRSKAKAHQPPNPVKPMDSQDLGRPKATSRHSDGQQRTPPASQPQPSRPAATSSEIEPDNPSTGMELDLQLTSLNKPKLQDKGKMVLMEVQASSASDI